MIIRIRQSGGFAGVEAGWQINTDHLPENEAARVERDLGELKRLCESVEPPIGADMMRYDIEVSEGEETQEQLCVVDDADPENPLLVPLHELLSAARTASLD